MLENTRYRLENNLGLTVVYFGGSITEGSGASVYDNCWAAKTTAYFKNKYPDCAINRAAQPDLYETLRAYMADLDIAYIRTAGGDNDSFSLPDDWYLWMPTAHHDNGHIMEYIDKFISLDVSAQYIAQRHPRLFYLWGHAFEFERNQNWAHLEEIAAKLGGRDDVWYATNIEIHDYVTAYKQLKYSADESIVYNPTLFDIWFDIDRTLYKIKPGETITLG